MGDMKGCPFCGGKVERNKVVGGNIFVISEYECKGCGMVFYYKQKLAMSSIARVALTPSFEDVWNSRVETQTKWPSYVPKADLERLAAELKKQLPPCKPGDRYWWVCEEKELQDPPGNAVYESETPIKSVVLRSDGWYIETVDCCIEKIGSRWALLTREDAEKLAREMGLIAEEEHHG